MPVYDSAGYVYEIELLRNEGWKPQDYPFALPAVRGWDRLRLHERVTFFVGENGSGKSTLVEALAIAWGFNAEGGTKNLAYLRAEAAREGYSHMKMLAARWADASERFDQHNEALFGVFAHDACIVIGGVTREPANPTGDVMRARRFYTLPEHRGAGIGTSLVTAIVQQAFQCVSVLQLRSTRAGEFWRKMGFALVVDEPGVTHRLMR